MLERQNSPIDIEAFIAGYTTASSGEHIRFDWNGLHSEQFLDRNSEFREHVREAVLGDLSNSPVELIRDLFRAETEYSRHAWCIVDGVWNLAEAMLRRGGFRFLDDYLVGKFQSFDASLGSVFPYDLSLARDLLAEVRERLRLSPTSPMAPLWEKGENLFSDWVSERENHGG
jgi:hypothetical protein